MEETKAPDKQYAYFSINKNGKMELLKSNNYPVVQNVCFLIQKNGDLIRIIGKQILLAAKDEKEAASVLLKCMKNIMILLKNPSDAGDNFIEELKKLEHFLPGSSTAAQSLSENGITMYEKRLISIQILSIFIIYWNTQNRSGTTNKQWSRAAVYILLHCLSLYNQPIKDIVCNALSIIAAVEYKNTWDMIKAEMFHPNPNEQTCMMALSFTKSFLKHAVPNALRSSANFIFDYLQYVYTSTTFNYSIRVDAMATVRAIIVVCFQNCDLEAYSNLLPIVQRCCEDYSTILLNPSLNVPNEITIQRDIISTFICIIKYIPEFAIHAFTNVFPIIWNLLKTSAEDYEMHLRYHSSETTASLAYDIFEMIHHLIFIDGYSLLNNVLPDLLHYIILFMTAPRAVVDFWNTHMKSWYHAELYGEYPDTFRRDKLQLLIMCLIVKIGPTIFFPAFVIATEAHIRIFDLDNRNYTSRKLEAIMYVMGLLTIVIHKEKELKISYSIPIHRYLMIFRYYCEVYNLPLLTARTMWFEGKFCKIMDKDTFVKCCRYSIDRLTSKSYMEQLSAIIALKYYIRLFKDNEIDCSWPLQVNILLIWKLKTDDDLVTHKGLYTLAELYLEYPDVIQSTANEISSTLKLLIVKNRYSNNVEACTSIVFHLLRDEHTRNIFINVMLTFIETDLDFKSNDTLCHFYYFSCFYLLIPMVLFSPSPADVRVLQLGFFQVYECLLRYEEDLWILQKCIQYLCVILNKNHMQLEHYISNDGIDGWDIIFTALRIVLQIKPMQNFSRPISALCLALIDNYALSNYCIGFLLQRSIDLLQQDLNPYVEENVFLIISFLIYNNVQYAVAYLAFTPGPGSESLLSNTLKRWVKVPSPKENFSKYKRACCFCKLIEYAIVKNDTRLLDIYIVEKEKNAGPDEMDPQAVEEYIHTPILLKLMKIILLLLPAKYMEGAPQVFVEAPTKSLDNKNQIEHDDIFFPPFEGSSYLKSDLDYELDLFKLAKVLFTEFQLNDTLSQLFELLSFEEKEIIRKMNASI